MYNGLGTILPFSTPKFHIELCHCQDLIDVKEQKDFQRIGNVSSLSSGNFFLSSEAMVLGCEDG